MSGQRWDKAVANWGISAFSASAKLGHHSKGLQTDEAGEGYLSWCSLRASHRELLDGGLFPGPGAAWHLGLMAGTCCCALRPDNQMLMNVA